MDKEQNFSSLLIGGDFYVPKQKHNQEYFSDQILELFQTDDIYSIINLEAPITYTEEKRIKTGPNLKMHPSSISLLDQLKINCVTLSNNHIMDYEVQGLLDTYSYLDENKINHVGSVIDNDHSHIYKTIILNHKKVGIINISENEWSSSYLRKDGAYSLDLINNSDLINFVKKIHDKTIIIYHGGIEYFPYPTPDMRERLKFFLRQGADLVVCHHSHCISGIEHTKEGKIIYGIGNFLFDLKSNKDEWYRGLIAKIHIVDDEIVYNLIPTIQDKTTTKLNINDNNYLEEIDCISRNIENDNKYLSVYNEFVKMRSSFILNETSTLLHIKNPYLKTLFYKLNILLASFFGYTYLLNIMRCESIRELTISVLTEFYDNKN